MATQMQEATSGVLSRSRMQPEVVVRRSTVRDVQYEQQSSMESMASDDVQAQIEARVKSALDEAMLRYQPEIAEPQGWWNLYAIGPIQSIGVPGPLLPHQIIKVGETAFVGTILFLNPFLVVSPGVTPASILSNFALPYEVRYQTGNLTTWTIGPANLNVVFSGPGFNLVPGVNFYVNILSFTATTPGLYEMNISARLLGATPPYVNAPQFAGYARAVIDIDPDLFISPAPGLQFDQPIRFEVYP
jgi:hypothetical protein